MFLPIEELCSVHKARIAQAAVFLTLFSPSGCVGWRSDQVEANIELVCITAGTLAIWKDNLKQIHF